MARNNCHLVLAVPLALIFRPIESIGQERNESSGKSRDDVVQRDLDYSGEAAPAADLRKLDVYLPPNSDGAKRPLVIWIHGGGWRKGDKERVGAKPKLFCDKGYILASVGYRLVPEVGYRDQASDIAQAIQFARANASRWGGDPDRVYLMGHSAGAHLAALVATDQRYLLAQSVPPDCLTGVILLDGAGYDIPAHMASAGPVAQRLYRSVFGNSPAAQAAASPITYVEKGKRIPPFLILHVADRRDSTVQSNRLAAALRDAGVRAAAVPCAGKNHMTINRELGNPGDGPTAELVRFLDETETAPNATGAKEKEMP